MELSRPKNTKNNFSSSEIRTADISSPEPMWSSLDQGAPLNSLGFVTLCFNFSSKIIRTLYRTAGKINRFLPGNIWKLKQWMPWWHKKFFYTEPMSERGKNIQKIFLAKLHHGSFAIFCPLLPCQSGKKQNYLTPNNLLKSPSPPPPPTLWDIQT